jgi:hypothetical protein
MATINSTSSKNFLIAAGGTGMRCLQSFLNMCALGMMSGETIDILLLETDIENGDKKNSENLFNWYNTLTNGKGGPFEYFGAKINFYVFVPDYSKDNQRRFTLISRLEEGNAEVNRMLTDLFYEEGVQEFDLMHGFRAQTHVGSYLMYHAFIDEIRRAVSSDVVRNKSQLYHFINKVKEQNTAGEARVFVLGSTFGGTGASSIPVMARAITDSAKVISGGVIQMENMFFGAVILTPYFSFKSPSKEHKKAEKVIADSQFFAHNSAAALMYYIKDNTILSTYKRFYMMGWPFSSLNMDDYKAMVYGDNSGKTITGGKSQENPAHPVEFISAFAARHFLMATDKGALKETYSTEVKFKAIEYEQKGGEKFAYVYFDDLIEGDSTAKGSAEATKSKELHKLDEILANNFTGMYYFHLLLQQVYEGNLQNLLKNLKRYNFAYNFKDEEIEAMNYFSQYFTYTKLENAVKPGWVPQMWYSMNKPANGEFLGYHADTMSVVGNADGAKRQMLFNELSKGNKNKEADLFISHWLKVNSPLKAGSKDDFYAHLRTTINSFKRLIVKN